VVHGPVGGGTKVRRNHRRSRPRWRRQTRRQKKHGQSGTQADSHSSEHLAKSHHCRELTQRSRSAMALLGQRGSPARRTFSRHCAAPAMPTISLEADAHRPCDTQSAQRRNSSTRSSPLLRPTDKVFDRLSREGLNPEGEGGGLQVLSSLDSRTKFQPCHESNGSTIAEAISRWGRT
jgi:hypothetical protein